MTLKTFFVFDYHKIMSCRVSVPNELIGAINQIKSQSFYDGRIIIVEVKKVNNGWREISKEIVIGDEK